MLYKFILNLPILHTSPRPWQFVGYPLLAPLPDIYRSELLSVLCSSYQMAHYIQKPKKPIKHGKGSNVVNHNNAQRFLLWFNYLW